MVYYRWAVRMRDLRVALISIPPLLTDLIRHALMRRVQVTVEHESTDIRDLEPMAGLVDVVLLGSPGGPDAARAAVQAEILILSDDLREFCWLAAGRSMPLSIENLVGTLERIQKDLDLRPRSNPNP